jgi:hypothetical protein
LKVTEGAVYRIQAGSNKMYFSHSPTEQQLPAASSTDDGEVEPDQKRQKTDL